METEIKISEKRILRKEMSQRRNKLTPGEIQRYSQLVFERLCRHDIYRQAPVVYSYASFRSEVDIWKFNQQVLSDGKILALPKVLGKERMEFYRIDSIDRLIEGYMGIREPGPECPPIDWNQPEYAKGIIIVPGLAFDGEFYRLGYGGGYYDRYLSACCSEQRNGCFVKSDNQFLISCSVAYDDQMVEMVPRERTDYPLDYIVTETKILERMDGK